MQAKGCDVRSSQKDWSFEQKLELRQSKESSGDFSKFQYLNKFTKTSDSDIENTKMDSKIKSTVHEHFNPLQQIFGVNFPKVDYSMLNSLLWELRPFTNYEFDLGSETTKLRSELVDIFKRGALERRLKPCVSELENELQQPPPH